MMMSVRITMRGEAIKMTRSSPPVQLWTRQQTADYLGVPVQTLAHWRINGRGPRAFRVGKYLRYDPADVADWLESQRDSA